MISARYYFIDNHLKICYNIEKIKKIEGNMITQVQLQRFKKFKNATIELKPFSILMGENSCGKTTILQAINLSLNTFAYNELIKNKNGEFKAKESGVSATHIDGINNADFRELYYSKVSRGKKAATSRDKQIGAIISLKDEKENNLELQVSSLFGSFNMKCVSAPEDLNHTLNLDIKAPLFISGFVGLEESERRLFPANIKQHLSSGKVSDIIRNLVLDLKNNNPLNYQKLTERLDKDFGFQLDRINFNANSDLYVTAQYKEKLEGKNLSFSFNSSGSGYMQVLQILAPIYSVCPNECEVVLLDEPDAHLHPNMQVALAKSLKTIQQELGIQIIISTHSPSIIKTAAPNEIIPISATVPVCKPLSSEEEVTDNIALLDNYELAKTVIGGRIIFLEDSNTEILEQVDKLLSTKLFSGAKITTILKGRTKDDSIPFKLKSVLKEFLQKDIDIFYLKDSDGLSETWLKKWIDYGKNANIELIILNNYEIENYLLNASVIHRAILRNNPNKTLPTVQEIEDKILSLLKNTILLASSNYTQNLEDNINKSSIILDKKRVDLNELRRQAAEIRTSYEQLTTKEELIKYGMGKESLKSLLKWINEDLKLQLGKKNIITELSIDDIPDELKNILYKLSNYEAPISEMQQLEITLNEIN